MICGRNLLEQLKGGELKMACISVYGLAICSFIIGVVIMYFVIKNN